MSKAVIFCGSPRKKGITRTLVEKVMEGIRSQGWETVFYDLNMEGIRGCQHCGYCRTHAGCALRDPLAGMYQDIAEADAIVFGTPIYFYSLTGQSKIWLDRLYPMFDTPSYESRYPGKRSVTVFVQGYEDPSLYQSVFRDINGLFDRWGWNVTDSILSAGETQARPDLLERAWSAGIRCTQPL